MRAQNGGRAPYARPAIEQVKADLRQLHQIAAPDRHNVVRVVMRREPDARIDRACQCCPGHSPRARPSGRTGMARPHRSIACETELAARRAFGALEHHGADAGGEGGMPRAVEHDLRNRAHARWIIARFVPRGGSEAIERARLRVGVRRAKVKAGRGRARRLDRYCRIGHARGFRLIGQQGRRIWGRRRKGEAHLRASGRRGKQDERGAKANQKDDRKRRPQGEMARPRCPFRHRREKVCARRDPVRHRRHRGAIAASAARGPRGSCHKRGPDPPHPHCARGCGYNRPQFRNVG